MTRSLISLPRPVAGDYAPGMSDYVSAAPDLNDAVQLLTMQRDAVRLRLAAVPAGRASFRYAQGKWTVREVAGHLSDTERVFSYRLLRIGRGDETPLAGFDENAYVPAAGFERRAMPDVVEEWAAVRNATIALVKGMPAEAWTRRGLASEKNITTAALVYIIYGHVEHHLDVLRERYGVTSG